MATAGPSSAPVPGSSQAPIQILDGGPSIRPGPSAVSSSTPSLAPRPNGSSSAATSAPALNGVALPSPAGSNGGKGSDLFGRGVLRARLEAMAREHQMTFDEDALTYLALAAETRLRSLLTSSISAQLHRTTSSHVRAPPKSKSSGQPMWSHVAVADSNAVLEALSRENKDAEQSFRASRMDRIAREQEMQRAKERAERIVAASHAPDGADDGTGEAEGANGQGSGSGVSTPVKASSSGNSPPVFGAVSEKKSGSGRKSSKKAARDVSAEVAHKMSNATAMRNAGVFNSKKYSWMTSVPPVSSPLAGKKRKEGEEGEQANGQAPEEETSVVKKGKKRDKGSREEGQAAPRKRPRLTAPARREVLVARDATGAERRMMDDQVLTLDDLIFALEREGVGLGMGTTDEIVMRARVLGDPTRAKDAAKR